MGFTNTDEMFTHYQHKYVSKSGTVIYLPGSVIEKLRIFIPLTKMMSD